MTWQGNVNRTNARWGNAREGFAFSTQPVCGDLQGCYGRGERNSPMRATPDFDFGLGEEAAMIRETVARFADEHDRPAGRRDRPRGQVPARPVAGDGRAGAARDHRGRSRRRARARLSRARHRDRGSEPRERLGRPQLRRAFELVHQPDRPLGHGRAEGEAPARADQRRARRRAGDERAGGGLGRGLDEAQGRRGAGRLRAQRQPSSGSPTGTRPRRWWSTARPTRPPARRASPRS